MIFDICIYGNELLRQHFKADVRDIWKVDSETIRWDFGVSQISWENSPWKKISLVNDDEVVSLSHVQVHVLWDSVLCLGRMNQNPTWNSVWKEQLGWFKDSPQHRTLDTIEWKLMEFDWNISQDSLHAVNQLSPKVHVKNERPGSIPRANHLHVDVQWHQKDFQQDVCHSSGLDQKVVFYLQRKTTRRRRQSRWMEDDTNSEKADTQFSDPRVHCLEERSKSGGGGKLSIHFSADERTIENVFHTLISVHQLSIYGAVSDLHEEYKACNVRTVRSDFTHCLCRKLRWWKRLHLRPMILRKKIYC